MKKLFLLLLLLGLLLSVSIFEFPTVQASTLTISTSISDGDISASSSTYSTAHDIATGTVTDDSSIINVGQTYSAPTYQVTRAYLFFDTSSIPDYATISSAALSIYIYDDSSTTNFYATIQKSYPTIPHDPLQNGDYYYNYYTGDGGSRSTGDSLSEGAYWNITLSAEGLTWISKTGDTNLCLRSDRDIGDVTPTGMEYITFYGSEYGGNDYAAKLYVTYSVGEEDYYHYTFYGPFNEETGLAVEENVTVAVWSSEGAPYTSFTLNQSYIYNVSTIVRNFEFTFDDGSKREYWVGPSETNSTTIYVFHGNKTGEINTYTIAFLDTTSILDTYPYVTAKRYVNGSLYTVEKRKVDVYDTVLMNLIEGRTYSIYLGSEDVTYVFGELTMTATTGVQLTLRGVDFPKETLLTQKYVRCYAYRNESIYVIYDDDSESTTSVLIEILYSDFTEATSTTLYTNSFNYEWASADSETSYLAHVTVTHETYGTLTFKTVLPADTALDTAPFNLDWLGDWGFDSSTLIPSLIILCVAGCFSALNAEVGAILMSIAAIILTIMGWIAIPVGFLVTAISLAILMALVYHKRRGGVGY